MKYKMGDKFISAHVMFVSFEVVGVDPINKQYNLVTYNENGEQYDAYEIDAYSLEKENDFVLLEE